MLYSKDKIKATVESKGYARFNDDENKTYDVNIVGIRNSVPGRKVTNLFDDTITVSYKDETGTWQYVEWANTTDQIGRAHV